MANKTTHRMPGTNTLEASILNNACKSSLGLARTVCTSLPYIVAFLLASFSLIFNWNRAHYLLERDEDKKQVYSWMRHPCLGTRFTKLETNVIMAFFLAYFENIQLCDKAGNLFDRVPPCNRNNYNPRKPDQDDCLKVKSRISH